MFVPKLMAGVFLTAAAMFGQSTITCNSNDMRRHYCSADTRDGVRLIRQRSEAACRQGSTWGYDRRGIWVDRGCRADFQLGGNDRGGNRRGGGWGNDGPFGRSSEISTLTCSSNDMRRNFCSVDTRGGVRLLRQRSDAACRQGSTWGYDRRGIWVDRGCRADFEVGGAGNGRDNRGYDRGRGRRFGNR